MPSFRISCTTDTRPSANLSTTLPTNPSQTTTSTVPFGISRPSTLPLKGIVFSCCNKEYVSNTTSLPFVDSSPIFNKPTVGFGLPSNNCA